jgi:hypothetical protein
MLGISRLDDLVSAYRLGRLDRRGFLERAVAGRASSALPGSTIRGHLQEPQSNCAVFERSPTAN